MVAPSTLYPLPITSPSIILYRVSSIDEPSPFSISVNFRIFRRLPVEAELRMQAYESPLKRAQMLKIQRATNKQVVFTLSGRMNSENVSELKGLIESEARARRIVLEL